MSRAPVVGVLGGLGPRASARFLESVYEAFKHLTEQEQPEVLLWSTPTIPDRTQAILAGDTTELANRIQHELCRLDAFGVDEIAMCCVTAHAVLPSITGPPRAQLVDLLELVFAEVGRHNDSVLMLCTSGTRAARVFEDHMLWPTVDSQVVMPSIGDQELIHDALYDLKHWAPPERAAELFLSMANRYGVRGVVAGCTETHLVHEELKTLDPALRVIDPLMALVNHMKEPSRV